MESIMLKKIFLFASAVAFSGCSSTPQKVDLIASNKALITSKCSQSCKATVDERLGKKTALFNDNKLEEVSIVRINGQKKIKNGAELKRYNSSWDGSYELEVDTGLTKTQLNYRLTSDKRAVLLDLNLEAGKSYFIGRIRDTSDRFLADPNGGQGLAFWAWAPVVVDLDSMKVIEPVANTEFQFKTVLAPLF